MDELVTYLRSEEISVRCEAFSILLGLVQNDEALEEIRLNSDEYVEVILNESLRADFDSNIKQKEICNLALSSLVNICGDENLAELITTSIFIEKISELFNTYEKQVTDKDGEGIEKVIMIISNISRVEHCVQILLSNESLSLRLFHYFISQSGLNNKEACLLLPKIIMNIASFHDGRLWLLKLDPIVWEGVSAKCRTEQSARIEILKIIKNLFCDSETLNTLGNDPDRSKRIIHLLLRPILAPSSQDQLNASGNHSDQPEQSSAAGEPQVQSSQPIQPDHVGQLRQPGQAGQQERLYQPGGQFEREVLKKCYGFVGEKEARLVIAECLNAISVEPLLASQAYDCGVCYAVRKWIEQETDPDIREIMNEQLVQIFERSAAMELEEPVLVRAEQYL